MIFFTLLTNAVAECQMRSIAPTINVKSELGPKIAFAASAEEHSFFLIWIVEDQ